MATPHAVVDGVRGRSCPTSAESCRAQSRGQVVPTLLNLKWQGGLEPYFGGRWTPHSGCPSKPRTKVPPMLNQPRRERASPVTTSVPWSQTGQGGCLRHRVSSRAGFGQPWLKAVLLSQPQARTDSHFLLHHIPEKESTTALAGVAGSCLAGREVS